MYHLVGSIGLHDVVTKGVPLVFPGFHELQKGTISLGMVTNIEPNVGLTVKLPFGGIGTVAVTDLADAYRPNPWDKYSKDQLLRSADAAASCGLHSF